jgi:DNA topoisomerase VI subunit B
MSSIPFSFLCFSWSSYKINQQQDKIGVFVSIVSTKIPFKGTGKEYIGDDITEISSAVKVHFNFPDCCVCEAIY